MILSRDPPDRPTGDEQLSFSVRWIPGAPLLNLGGKPAFFNAGSGYTWPWVDPTGTTKLYTLPAKARFDNGTPFVQP